MVTSKKEKTKSKKTALSRVNDTKRVEKTTKEMSKNASSKKQQTKNAATSKSKALRVSRGRALSKKSREDDDDDEKEEEEEEEEEEREKGYDDNDDDDDDDNDDGSGDLIMKEAVSPEDENERLSIRDGLRSVAQVAEDLRGSVQALHVSVKTLRSDVDKLKSAVSRIEERSTTTVNNLITQIKTLSSDLSSLQEGARNQEAPTETTIPGQTQPLSDCNSLIDVIPIAKKKADKVEVSSSFVSRVFVSGPIKNIQYLAEGGEVFTFFADAVSKAALTSAKEFVSKLVTESGGKIGNRDAESDEFTEGAYAQVYAAVAKVFEDKWKSFSGSILRRATKFLLANAGTLGLDQVYEVKEKDRIVEKTDKGHPVVTIGVVKEALSFNGALIYAPASATAAQTSVTNPFAPDEIPATQTGETAGLQQNDGLPALIRKSKAVKRLTEATTNTIEGLPRLLFRPNSNASTCGAFASTCIAEQLIQLFGRPQAKTSALRFNKNEAGCAVSAERAKNVRNKLTQPMDVLAEAPLSVYQIAYACYTFVDTLLDRSESNIEDELKALLREYIKVESEENVEWKLLKRTYLDQFYTDVLALACLVAEHQTINEDGTAFTCKAGCPFPISKLNNASAQAANV